MANEMLNEMEKYSWRYFNILSLIGDVVCSLAHAIEMAVFQHYGC